MEPLVKKSQDLQVCPVCKSSLVYLVEKKQINDIEWKISLLCPNCFLLQEPIMVHRETARKLSKNARVGRENLAKVLAQMEKMNMEEEAEKMISALNKDHILPIDF